MAARALSFGALAMFAVLLLYYDISNWGMAETGAESSMQGEKLTKPGFAIINFTEVQKQGIGYITLSRRENQIALQLSDQGQPFAQVVAPDESRRERMWQHIELAHEFAKMVEDETLDEAHPELRARWRNQYQEGLYLRLQGHLGADTIGNDVMAEFKGVKLLNQFNSWWHRNRRDIDIFRG